MMLQMPFNFEKSNSEADRLEEENSFELVCEYDFSPAEKEENQIPQETEEAQEEVLPELFRSELPLRNSLSYASEDYSSKYFKDFLNSEEDELGEGLDQWEEAEEDISENDLFELIDHLEALNEEQQYRSLLETRRGEDTAEEAYDPYNRRFNNYYEEEKIPEISLAPKVNIDEDF